MRLNTSLNNVGTRLSLFANVRDIPHYPFNGQIWLLTSGANFSASSLFALHAKEMDFAILVGDKTSGGYTAGAVTYFALPNTGIVVMWDTDYLTDQFGRSLNEFPTTPHYYNEDGFDALETVLRMIETGDGCPVLSMNLGTNMACGIFEHEDILDNLEFDYR